MNSGMTRRLAMALSSACSTATYPAASIPAAGNSYSVPLSASRIVPGAKRLKWLVRPVAWLVTLQVGLVGDELLHIPHSSLPCVCG